MSMNMVFVKILWASFQIALCTCQLTWFEAQNKCRLMNQTLTREKNYTGFSYWTGFSKKTSNWIKILGCYNESIVQSYQIHNMNSSSPGLCHDKCLERNLSFFAVQAEKCICLSNGFNYSLYRLSPSECNYTCTNSMLLSAECGGSSAYNVYLTESLSRTFKSHCLSLQCGNPDLVDRTCNLALPPICHERNLKDFAYSWNWTQGRDNCKANGTYLIANIDLTNKTSACTNFNNTSPSWIGVIRDQYEKTDKGQLIANDTYTHFNKCERCHLQGLGKGVISECDYVDCNKKQNVYLICSETLISVTQPSTTTQGENDLSSKPENVTNMNFTEGTESHTDRPIAEIVVPVVLVVLLSACAVLIVLYFRRKKCFKEKNTEDANKSPTMNSENYSDIDNNINKNYFILQQSNPSYELPDHAKIECKVESPYNEAEDGTYDHLGKKDVRKESNAADDTYNHASSVMSPDLSDYDVANNKQVHEEDNDYDHASPGENSYGHFHTSQKQETDYSEMF